MFKEKAAQAIELLNEFNIDLWLTFVRETKTLHDPSLDFICPTALTWQSALMFTRKGKKVAIVGALDDSGVRQAEIYDEVIPYKGGVREELVKFLQSEKPKNIAVNYSKNSEMADGLSHGMYLILLDYLKGTGFEDKLVSSEDIISALRGRKTEEELRRIKEAARITSEIYDTVTGFLKPGLTEKEVAAFILEEVDKRGLKTAWGRDTCPSVFTGPDTAGAHFGPTDRKIERGHILNMDFGVTFEDYVSDMQRTWYVLREGETEAPENVLRGFETIKKSIRLAAGECKPGKEGRELDKIARDYIVSQGYDEYPHALGHQFGRAAHDGTTLLCPEWERYGERPYMKLEKNQVYTIEPRLSVDDLGTVTIEEEIVVTEDGGEFLTEPQKEIYLVK